jgi:hypothetical protein
MPLISSILVSSDTPFWVRVAATVFDLAFGFLFLVGLVLVFSSLRGPR